MKNVTLYHLDSEKLKVDIIAYIHENGDLRIDGYDLGQTVEDLKGSRDYEYHLTVQQEHVDLLHTIWKTTDENILDVLQQKFNGNYAFSEFRSFLKEQDIPFKQFYWS